jgi:hypothetical protein
MLIRGHQTWKHQQNFYYRRIKFMIFFFKSQNLAQFNNVDFLDLPYMKILVMLLSKNIQAQRKCP